MSATRNEGMSGIKEGYHGKKNTSGRRVPRGQYGRHSNGCAIAGNVPPVRRDATARGVPRVRGEGATGRGCREGECQVEGDKGTGGGGELLAGPHPEPRLCPSNLHRLHTRSSHTLQAHQLGTPSTHKHTHTHATTARIAVVGKKTQVEKKKIRTQREKIEFKGK